MFWNVGQLVNSIIKEEAISWAWELLTKVYARHQSHLCFCIWRRWKEGLEPDHEAAEIWKRFCRRIEFCTAARKTILGNGDTGPCGPCSEIHYDMRTEGWNGCRSGQGKKSTTTTPCSRNLEQCIYPIQQKSRWFTGRIAGENTSIQAWVLKGCRANVKGKMLIMIPMSFLIP